MRVDPIAEHEFELVLPLIAAYQRFYEAEADPARNADFFRRFIAPSDAGMLLGAWEGEELRGHACLYWTFSSVSARDVVLLNDLYVVPEARGRGVGRALIEAAAGFARARGAASLTWYTAPDNLAAQRLYDTTGAARSSWLEYELPLDRG